MIVKLPISHINGAMLPGTLWLETSMNGDVFCAKCKKEITDPLWIVTAGDFHQSCPTCFGEECKDTPDVSVSFTQCKGHECHSEGTYDCVRCQQPFCQWHVGRLPVTKAFICKTCSDTKRVTPLSKLDRIDHYACAGGGCEDVGTHFCVACETWVCRKHRSKANDTLCTICERGA